MSKRYQECQVEPKRQHVDLFLEPMGRRGGLFEATVVVDGVPLRAVAPEAHEANDRVLRQLMELLADAMGMSRRGLC